MYKVEYYISQKGNGTDKADKLSNYAARENNKNKPVEILDSKTRHKLTEQGLSAFYGEKITIKADKEVRK